MVKKVTIKRTIPADKQGYLVRKDNLRDGEKILEVRGNYYLVNRNRSKYERTFTGYKLTQTELKEQFAKKQKAHPRATKQDLARRAKNTLTAPVLTTKQFFDFRRKDVEGIDTPGIAEIRKKILSRTNLTGKELDKLVKNKLAEMDDYITEFGAYNIIERELEISDSQLKKKSKTKKDFDDYPTTFKLNYTWVKIHESGELGFSLSELKKNTQLNEKELKTYITKLLESGDIYEFSRNKFKSIGHRSIPDNDFELMQRYGIIAVTVDPEPEPEVKKPIVPVPKLTPYKMSKKTEEAINGYEKQIDKIDKEIYALEKHMQTIHHTELSSFKLSNEAFAENKDQLGREHYQAYEDAKEKYEQSSKEISDLKNKQGKIRAKRNTLQTKDYQKEISKEVPEKVQKLFGIEPTEARIADKDQAGMYFDSTRITAFSPLGKGLNLDDVEMSSISVDKFKDLAEKVEFIGWDYISLESDDGKEHCVYSYDFLKPYFKVAESLGITEISFGTETPIVIKTKKGNFYIAPRILDHDEIEDSLDSVINQKLSFDFQEENYQKKKDNLKKMNKIIPTHFHDIFKIEITPDTDVDSVKEHLSKSPLYDTYFDSDKVIGYSKDQTQLEAYYGVRYATIPLKEIAQAVSMKKADITNYNDAVYLLADNNRTYVYDRSKLKELYRASKKAGIIDVAIDRAEKDSILTFITKDGNISLAPIVPEADLREGEKFDRAKQRTEQLSKRKMTAKPPKKVAEITDKKTNSEKIAKLQNQPKPKIHVPGVEELESNLYHTKRDRKGLETRIKKATESTEKASLQSDIDFLKEKEKHYQNQLNEKKKIVKKKQSTTEDLSLTKGTITQTGSDKRDIVIPYYIYSQISDDWKNKWKKVASYNAYFKQWKIKKGSETKANELLETIKKTY